MDEKNLSQRLKTAAKYVFANARLADIGSDHAYLPAYLALQGKIDFAICGEVVAGPLHNAEHVILKNNLNDKLVARLADGLAAVTPEDNVDCISICGMGGTLIANILQAGEQLIAQTKPRLILQPNVGENNVRQWLVAHHYRIVAEEILAEDHHTYEIIVADPSEAPVALSEADVQFGPFLRQEKNHVFIAKWQHELAKLATIKAAMQKANNLPVAKLQEVDAEINRINQILGSDDNDSNN